MPNDRWRSTLDMLGLVAYFTIVSGEMPDRAILDHVTDGAASAVEDDGEPDETVEPILEPAAA